MKHIASLDGLRGAAAVSVVLAHYVGEVAHGTAALSFGWIGVGVFFSLSGYLIGSIIFDGCGQPEFFQRFYVRRFIRIVPVYALTVLATLLALRFCHGQSWAVPAFGLPVYLSFTQNIAIAVHGAGSLWLLPTWTLAVEEQFYLLLPILIVLVPRPYVIGTLLLLVVTAILFRLCAYGIGNMAGLTLMPAKADVLLSGVIAAWLQRRIDLSRHLFMLRVIPLVAACILLATCLVDGDRLFKVVGPSLLGIGAASFILALAHGAPEGWRFSGRRMGSMGMISYPLYLVHQPINGLLHGLILGGTPDIGTPAQGAVTMLALALSVALAYASWHYIEAPLLAWAKTKRRIVPSIRWSLAAASI